jgi:hypothetical protein
MSVFIQYVILISDLKHLFRPWLYGRLPGGCWCEKALGRFRLEQPLCHYMEMDAESLFEHRLY